MSASLPPLPVEKGFEALRRGLIHGHPASDWLGARDHFDWSLPPDTIYARLKGLLGDAALHRRYQELMILADWMLEHPRFPANRSRISFMRTAVAHLWNKSPCLPPEFLDWTLDRLFSGRIDKLWLLRRPVLHKNDASPTDHLGEALMSAKDPGNALLLASRLQQCPSRTPSSLPWHRYAIESLSPGRDNGPPLLHPDVFAVLLPLAPKSATLALHEAFLQVMDRYQSKGGRWSPRPILGQTPDVWPALSGLVDHLGHRVDLSMQPLLWPNLMRDAAAHRKKSGRPLDDERFSRLLRQLHCRAGNKIPEQLIRLASVAFGCSQQQAQAELEHGMMECATSSSPIRSRALRL